MPSILQKSAGPALLPPYVCRSDSLLIAIPPFKKLGRNSSPTYHHEAYKIFTACRRGWFRAGIEWSFTHATSTLLRTMSITALYLDCVSKCSIHIYTLRRVPLTIDNKPHNSRCRSELWEDTSGGNRTWLSIRSDGFVMGSSRMHRWRFATRSSESWPVEVVSRSRTQVFGLSGWGFEGGMDKALSRSRISHCALCVHMENVAPGGSAWRRRSRRLVGLQSYYALFEVNIEGCVAFGLWDRAGFCNMSIKFQRSWLRMFDEGSYLVQNITLSRLMRTLGPEF